MLENAESQATGRTYRAKIYAWGFVGVVWYACTLHIFSKHPDVSVLSMFGLRFLVVDSVLAVLAIGTAHYLVQLGFTAVFDRLKLDISNKGVLMRLNRAGVFLILLEIWLIYSAAEWVFGLFNA
jgi:hypothetical protein